MKRPCETLTRRERQVYRLIVEEAATRKYICSELGLSINTVMKHIQNVHNKIGVNSNLELAVRHYTKLL
jgi:DNA-binding CsgD family transcriptional regulator